jgi:hypothetical protein
MILVVVVAGPFMALAAGYLLSRAIRDREATRRDRIVALIAAMALAVASVPAGILAVRAVRIGLQVSDAIHRRCDLEGCDRD